MAISSKLDADLNCLRVGKLLIEYDFRICFYFLTLFLKHFRHGQEIIKGNFDRNQWLIKPLKMMGISCKNA